MKQVTRLFDLLELYRDDYSSLRNAFNTIEQGTWKAYSAADYISFSDRISLGLLAMGVGRGTKVATVMVNCPEWNFFDMGLAQTGAIQVPVYPTISEENYKYILNDASVEYIVISNRSIYDRIKNILSEIPSLKMVFTIEKMEGLHHWKEILELGDAHPDRQLLEQIKSSIKPEEMVTIIYTSGTTGRPKGVMLSHHNFVTNYKALSKVPPLIANDRVISFLPLCHVYERTGGYCYQSMGVSIYYIQNLEELAESIQEVKPHAFAAVPRVLEKVYGGFTTKGRNLPMYKRILFFWAVRQGHKFELDHRKGWIFDIKLWLANLLILSKWKNALGGEIKFIVCGSASLHPRLTKIFWAAKMPVLEAYGLTETSPGITMYNFTPGGVRFGTVGKLLEDVRVKIADDGEILVKSPGVMLGYYNRPDRTAEVMDQEGWFHTGDIGELEDGYLKITDRKKEMFKTSSGKYIAPQVIEQRLKESPFIEHIMVVGENRKCTAALIVPDYEHLKAWCEVKHIHFISREKAIANPIIISRFQREINRFNLDLGQTEKIKKFILIPSDWTVASGEFSPTLKMRRKFIFEKYCGLIDEMYGQPEYDYRKGKV